MYIAICEENQKHALVLRSMIEEWTKKERRKENIACFSSGEQFLFHLDEKIRYDLVFLDLHLENMNELELAKRIRRKDKTMILIFTTESPEYAIRGYEVSAFRYLMKPLERKEVFDVLADAEQFLEQTRDRAVILKGDQGLRRIYKEDISYLESEGHFLSFYTNKETIRCRARLKDYERFFTEPQFCRCHRSYIVNMRAVERITKGSVMVSGGKILPISRNRYEAMAQCYQACYNQAVSCTMNEN